MGLIIIWASLLYPSHLSLPSWPLTLTDCPLGQKDGGLPGHSSVPSSSQSKGPSQPHEYSGILHFQWPHTGSPDSHKWETDYNGIPRWIHLSSYSYTTFNCYLTALSANSFQGGRGRGSRKLVMEGIAEMWYMCWSIPNSTLQISAPKFHFHQQPALRVSQP